MLPKYYVGIGCSAGGLEVLRHFFSMLPSNTGMAFIVIQHLAPNYHSILHELLSKETDMPVRVVKKKMVARRNHVYIISPGSTLLIEEGNLQLMFQEEHLRVNFPIDIFFSSLGKDKKEKSIGLILSGTGTDGCRGVKEIKEHGGYVITQDPYEAKFDGMPRSAQGDSDFIGTVEQCVGKLVKISKDKSKLNQPTLIEPKEVKQQNEVEEQTVMDHAFIRQILEAVYDKTGIDFSEFQIDMVKRRIRRRMQMTDHSTYGSYYKYLMEAGQEAEDLMDSMLINYTSFFRDPEAWERCREKVLVPLVKEVKSGGKLRIWVAGCSTGEEAYTLAILLEEVFEEYNVKMDVKLFATDLDQKALNVALEGVYSKESIFGIPDSYIYKYFDPAINGFKVKTALREKVVFANQNLLKDPAFIQLDLIVCRNVLIYFRSDVQKRLLASFSYALRKDRYLFLGNGEPLTGLTDIYGTLDQYHHIYSNRRPAKLPGITASYSTISNRTTSEPKSLVKYNSRKQHVHRKENTALNYYAAINHVLPAAILIDKDFRLYHTTGKIENYFRLSKGWKSRNLSDMLDDFELSVFKDGIVMVDKNPMGGEPIRISCTFNGKEVDLKFIKIGIDESTLGTEVVYVEFLESKRVDKEFYKVSENAFIEAKSKALEAELSESNKLLKITKEQLEITSEELRASNEELQVSNEELQISNEELQSVNEEVFAINDELMVKVKDLTTLFNDFKNLLASININTLFLDKELRMRHANLGMHELLDISDSDIGKEVLGYKNSLNYHNWEEDALKVLKSLQIVTKEVYDGKNGKSYIARILPYRTEEEEVKGVVITLEDVTTIRMLYNQLQKSEERMRLAIEGISAGIWDYNVMEDSFWPSSRYYEIMGYSKFEVPKNRLSIEKVVKEHVHPEEQGLVKKAFTKHLKSKGDFKLEYRIKSKSGQYVWVESSGKATFDHDGKPIRMIGAIVDIDRRKKLESEQFAYKNMMFRQTGRIAKIGGWEYNVQLGELIWSDELYELTGNSKSEKMIVMSDWIGQYVRESQEEVTKELDRCVKEGKQLDIIAKFCPPRGKPFWTRNIAEAVIDEEGKTKKIRGVFQLIEGLNDENLRRTLISIEKKNKHLEDFSRIVSHNLRKHTSNIDMMLELYGLTADSKVRETYIAKIRDVAEMLNRTILGLYEVTKVHSNNSNFKEKVALKEVYYETVTLFENEINDKQIKLYPDFSSCETLEMPRSYLNSILHNLIGNAVKYTSSERFPKIEVKAEEHEHEFLLSVADNGIGIDLEKYGDDIFQIQSTFHGELSGTGHGLYLTKAHVDNMGGNIEVESKVNIGTTFTIRLKKDLVHLN
ncbi:CheR family methyltransferase [Limibacter armeniacum]|uniref:CheR family methyltransferase n=1 Tax=Limibacter armeniacum TaxID=466084 RepID=UPI002FE51738